MQQPEKPKDRRRRDYLAQAKFADSEALKTRDGTVRNSWKLVAEEYRRLARDT